MDASHLLPLTLGPENGSRLKAVVWIASFNAGTKKVFGNYIGGEKKLW